MAQLTILAGSERGDRVSARSGVNTQIFTAENLSSNLLKYLNFILKYL